MLSDTAVLCAACYNYLYKSMRSGRLSTRPYADFRDL